MTTLERMGPLDAWFLYAEEDGVNHMNILSFIVLEGPPPPYEDLLALVESKLPQLPRYRQVIRTVPLQIGRPVWVDDASFDLQFHVRQTALPQPGDDTVLERLISRLMAQQFDRARPLWELWSVEGLTDGRWVLLSKLHHAMVDGVSGADMVSILLDKEPKPKRRPHVPWEPAPAPSNLEIFGGTARGIATSPVELARAATSAVKAPRDAAATVLAGLGAGRRALSGGSASSLNGPIGPSRRYTWTSYALDDVKRVRKALGGTLNDIVVATATRGFRDLLLSRGEDVADRTVRVIIPIALHARDAKGTAVASGLYENRITGVLADLPVGEPDPVVRARLIHEQLAALKASREGVAGDTITKLSGFAPATFLALGQRAAAKAQQGTINSVVSNVPGPQIPLYALGREVLAAYPSPPIFPVGARMGVAVFSYNGNLHFGLIADYSTVPDLHGRGRRAGRARDPAGRRHDVAAVKRVLVLGAASGIGHACATALAADGWHVLGGDMAEIEPGGVVAESAVFDVRDPAAVEAGIARLAEGGPFDALVNAAGLARVAPLTEITPKGWGLLIDVNLTGAFNVLSAAASRLADGGAIVIISSIDSALPVSGLAHYCASKAGVEALSRSAALELGPRGIRCNVVAPGVVRTPLMASFVDRPEVSDAFTSRTPLGRLGAPDDVADVVTFLVSPAARWITGARIPVDGGLSLREHPSMLTEPERTSP